MRCTWSGPSTRAGEVRPLGRPPGKAQLLQSKGECPEGTVQVLHGGAVEVGVGVGGKKTDQGG